MAEPDSTGGFDGQAVDSVVTQAFHQAMRTGAAPGAAFDAAAAAARTMAAQQGLPVGVIDDAIHEARAEFQAALDAGVDPIAAFGDTLGGGEEASPEAPAVEAPPVAPEPASPPVDSPPIDNPAPAGDLAPSPIEVAAREAFNEALGDGATPEQALRFASNAALDLGKAEGVPEDVMESAIGELTRVFMDARDDGADAQASLDAALSAVRGG